MKLLFLLKPKVKNNPKCSRKQADKLSDKTKKIMILMISSTELFSAPQGTAVFRLD